MGKPRKVDSPKKRRGKSRRKEWQGGHEPNRNRKNRTGTNRTGTNRHEPRTGTNRTGTNRGTGTNRTGTNWPDSQKNWKTPSSRNDSHRNSVQNALIGISTALMATIFMTISNFGRTVRTGEPREPANRPGSVDLASKKVASLRAQGALGAFGPLKKVASLRDPCPESPTPFISCPEPPKMGGEAAQFGRFWV